MLGSDEKPDVKYSDVGGLDAQKQEIREAVELPLEQVSYDCLDKTCAASEHGLIWQMDLYRKIGIDPPRGVLLYGPPGKLAMPGLSPHRADSGQELERQCWSRQSQMQPRHPSSESLVPSLSRNI